MTQNSNVSNKLLTNNKFQDQLDDQEEIESGMSSQVNNYVSGDFYKVNNGGGGNILVSNNQLLSPIQESKSSSLITPTTTAQLSREKTQSQIQQNYYHYQQQQVSSGRNSQYSIQQQKEQYQQQHHQQVDQNFSFDQKIQPLNKHAKQKLQKSANKINIISSSSQKLNKNQREQQISEIDNLKFKVEQLFSYYCDYSIEKGEIFIKQSSLIKMLKDAKIMNSQDNNSAAAPGFIDQNSLILLMSKETGNPSLKSLDFLSFLNLLVKLSYLIYNNASNASNADPKDCLQKLLSQYILPLLETIEDYIQNNFEISKSNISYVTENGQYISNVSMETLKQISCSQEDFQILASIKNVFKLMYDYFFASNNKKVQNILKKLFKFLKDLDISPYLINQKTCFMIYYFTCISKGNMDQRQGVLGIVETIENLKLKQKSLSVKAEIEENGEFTFEEFLSIFYRLSIAYFDYNMGSNNIPSYKKLLSFLSRIELTKGFGDFVSYYRQFKSMNAQFYLTPPKSVLVNIYLKQQNYESEQEMEYVKDQMLNSLDSFQISKLLITDQIAGGGSLASHELINVNPLLVNQKLQQQRQHARNDSITKSNQNYISQVMEQSQSELENYFEQVEDQLVKIFQSYCSFGDPLNTNKLKSSKFLKIFQDALLVVDNQTHNKINQANSYFNQSPNQFQAQTTRQTANFLQSQQDVRGRSKDLSEKSQSQVSNKSVSQQSRNNQNQQNDVDRLNSEKLKNTNTVGISRNELDLIFKKVATQQINHFNFSNKQSQITSTMSKSPNRNRNNSPFYSRDQQIVFSPVNQDLNSINYHQFKIAIFEASRQIFKNFNPYESCIMMIKERIMPLYGIGADARSIQNIKLQEMLLKLEDDAVIELLTDLHQVIHKIYESYADHKGLMDFNGFLKFCTDFSIFPDILSKADVHRIFMNLAFLVTQPSNFNESAGSQNLIKSQGANQMSSLMGSTISSTKGGGKNPNGVGMKDTLQKMKQVNVIDQHLFIEGLALCALHIDSTNYANILPKEQEAIEKILLFIEKIASSDGLKRGKEKKQEAKIKAISIERLDIMQFFRKKYYWYFEKKNEAQLLSQKYGGPNGQFMDPIKDLILREQLNQNKKLKQKQKDNSNNVQSSHMEALMRKSLDQKYGINLLSNSNNGGNQRNQNLTMKSLNVKTDLFSLVLKDQK